MILSGKKRLDRIRENLSAVKCGRLGLPERERTETLTIVGFGPTLQATWSDAQHPVLAVSGAHDFLVERGVIPDYYLEVHPTAKRSSIVKKPHKKTVYLIASTCHLAVFRALAKYDVRLWHAYQNDTLLEQHALRDELDPGTALIGGGTNGASRAVAVGRHLGFRRFVAIGVDCCWDGEQKWAGKHSPNGETPVIKRIGGRDWTTTRELMAGAMDFLNERRMGAEIEVRGDNFLAAYMQEAVT